IRERLGPPAAVSVRRNVGGGTSMKQWRLRAPLAVVATVLALGVSSSAALADEPTLIARGPHVSGVAPATSHQPAGAAAAAAASTCSTPGATNYKTNCHGT